MTDDGDRIDPARTEATIKRSLEKANQRRVKEPDMVERIETHLQNDDAAARHYECDNLLEEAQARIAELDGFIATINEQTTALEEENERLNKALKWEQHRSGRVGTHSPGCWAWGPQHYECAIQHIAALDKEIESAALIVGEIRKDLIDARTEIREMNRRIDLLRSRS
jgi:hypothetical protein